MTKPLVIIGTGLAGYMLAKEWRKLEKQQPLVMITLDDGAFYSKPLLSTALTNQKSPQDLVITPVAKMAEQLTATIHTYCRVTAIDPNKKVITYHCNGDEQTIEFSALVIACGAKKLSLPIEGNSLSHIQSVNSLEEYFHFRQWLAGKQRIAIIGSGLVGCEFANDLLNAGYQVDVFSADPFPLATIIPEKLGIQLLQEMQQQGIHWHVGHLVTAVNQRDKQYQITLSNGQQMDADGVFAAIGIHPHIALAQAAGIRTHRGIVVNRQLQTNFKDIYALGDCAEVNGTVKQYVAPILQCSRTLAKVLLGEAVYVNYPNMPIVIKTPVCPTVTLPPPDGMSGKWHYDGEGSDRRALFYDDSGELRGFALIGDKVNEKMSLAKQVPLEFSS